MVKLSKGDVVRQVLERHPRSHAEQLKIDVTKGTPAPLYQWLIASLLFSARISAKQALTAAKALFERGWRTPRKMAETTWKERVEVLNRSGYARYDESTSRYIGQTTEILIEEYGGDLRRLRTEAEREPSRERKLLKEFKGIGDVGADLFLREVQVPWDENYPFADKRALDVAARLSLGETAEDVARLVVQRKDLPRLLAALVSVDLAKEIDQVLRGQT